MKQPKEQQHGDAYALVKQVYDKSPGQSWRRLNSALHNALKAAITGHLSFLPDDFEALSHDTRGGYWMGNSEGSMTGERYYNLAVKVGHTPCCIAFERYAGRPAALWAESVKTPARLCISSDLIWQGTRLTLTNMREDHLIACAYPAYEASRSGASVGDADYFDGERRLVEHLRRMDDGSIVVRYSAPVKNAGRERNPSKVVKIPYAELVAARKQADSARKQALAEIAATETPASLQAVAARLNAVPRGTYRHFDIEELSAAITTKRKTFDQAECARLESASESEQLDAWRSGAASGRWFSQIALRVSGEYVESSNGHSVSINAVKRVLPFVLAHREQHPLTVSGLEIDIHPLRRISPDGVQIGCTLVPWPEVDRIAEALACERRAG